MSEYQYYEFRAIDRPLTQKQMDELGALSSRAEITPTSFTNTYNYGDFRGKPAALMDKYFDAFVYVANWGTHRLMLRIPRRFLDVEAASAYRGGDDGDFGTTLGLRAEKDHVVLDFCSREEGGDWEDGEPWMASLIGIRDELMRGDLRALYLGWLGSIQERGSYDEDDEEGEGDDEVEPPVPPGLAKLSAPLKALADFLLIDDDLIEAAAAGSAGEAPAAPSRDDLARWVKRLPAADKDAYLLRFLAEEGDHLLRNEMLGLHREATAPKGPRAPKAKRRTVEQLLAARDALVEEKQGKAAKKKASVEREQAKARAKYLDELAGREDAAWREVDERIATKQPEEYDRAVALVVDLLELAEWSGRREEAEARVRDLRSRNRNKSALLQRLDKKKLKA